MALPWKNTPVGIIFLLTSCDGVNDPNWETHLIEQAKNGFESDADEGDKEQGSENSELRPVS